MIRSAGLLYSPEEEEEEEEIIYSE